MKLDELAKLAGVSRTTASYVVNGKAKQYRVSEKTIERVQALVKKYDFKPNPMAAGLRAGRTNTIGLIIPDFENISYAKIANCLETRYREQGYQLLMTCSNDNPENEMQCAKQLFIRQVDALIVSTSLPSDSDFYQKTDVPVIGFDRQINAKNVANIHADDVQDAKRLALDFLSRQAYGRILFLGALPELSMSREREQGFREALKEKNIAVNSVDFVYAAAFNKTESAAAFKDFLAQHDLPDAIFTTSLTLLQGVLASFVNSHRAIPEKLVIATFGESEILGLLRNPVIASVQNYEAIVDSLLALTLKKLQESKRTLPSTDSLRRALHYYHW
ncbi:catabolite repressor/activator [Bisgaard Taxon 10/6]|uniref:catabolite repressor/activator n=1 Tax=Exercitatus varius TaxID=67857 RepID=UPI00294AE899|nr:catabolite repressor/activator [Exercitatus varius]MDG2953584.1 catabolite repressor/activator [Exercitatus varius]MDG2960116.1 catabolite repressor/activator [Exercitatus varius]